MFKKFNMFALTLLILGQTILGPIGGASVAFAEEPDAISETAEGQEANVNIEESAEDTIGSAEQGTPDKGEQPVEAPKTVENDETSTEEQKTKENDEALTGHPSVEKTEGEQSGAESIDSQLEADEEEVEVAADVEVFNILQDVDRNDPLFTEALKLTIDNKEVQAGGAVNAPVGASVSFRVDLNLEPGHSYGAGSKLVYELPPQFANLVGTKSLFEGSKEIGNVVVNGQTVTLTFTDAIRDETGAGTIVQDVWFEINGSLQASGNDWEENIQVPGFDTITLNFTPQISNANNDTKKGVADHDGENSEYIKWTVEVNKNLTVNETTGTTNFTDTLTGEHTFDSVESITKLLMGPNGNIISETSYTPLPSVSGKSMTIALPNEAYTAYRIVYKTKVGDPGNVERSTFKNEAQFGSSPKVPADVNVSFGTPLEKTGSGPNADLTTDWEIKYNHNKRIIPAGNAILTDTWTPGHVLDGNVTVWDENNNQVTTGFTVTNTADGNGFNLSFTADVVAAYTIKYKTKPNGIYPTTGLTISNTITRADITDYTGITNRANITYRKEAWVLNKQATGVDYQAKKMTWRIEANQAKYTLASGTTFTDTYNEPLLTVDGEPTVTVGGQSFTNFTFTPTTNEDGKETGFTIILNESVSDKIVIAYTTSYEITDTGTNTRDYTNTVVLENTGIVDFGSSTDSATQTIKGEQKANGKKTGEYNYETKTFHWDVELNFNYNTINNAVFKDILPESQKVTSMTVTKGSLNAAGDFVPSTDPDAVTTVDTTNIANLIEYSLGDITGPYKITYTSKDNDAVYPHGSDITIHNIAKLYGDGTSESNPNAEWAEAVPVAHTKNIILKDGSQVGSSPQMNWNFEFNYAQSELNDIVITDMVGKIDDEPSQLILKDSFKVWEMNFTGTNSTPSKGTEVQLTDENFTVDLANGTFTLKLPDGDKAYRVEYSTVFMGESGSTLVNEVSVSYTSADGNSGSHDYSRANFTYDGGGKVGTVPFVILKTDGATGLPMDDVKFDLYGPYTGNTLLMSGSTNANGELDYGVKLAPSADNTKLYRVVEEKQDGYKALTKEFILDRDLIELSGEYAGKQIIYIENEPENDFKCDIFELTVYDVDGNLINNEQVTLIAKSTGISQQVTLVNGKVNFKRDASVNGSEPVVKAGKYDVVYEGITLDEITVEYGEDCNAEVQPAPSCEVFTITVKDANENIRPGVEVELRTETGDVVDTFTTDSNGSFTVDSTLKDPNTPAPPGKYYVYEGKQLLGEVTITYTSDCNAEVKEVPSCPTFTLTVKDADGNNVVGQEVTIKDEEDNVVVTETTDANGQITTSNLDQGKYTVYDKDDNQIGESFTLNLECEAEVQIAPECPVFTITILDETQNVRPNIEVTLKKTNQDDITSRTDKDGKIEVPSEDLPAGEYNVYEGGIFLGKVTVTHINNCEAELDSTVSGAGTCPIFTITVNDRSNNPREDVDVIVKDANNAIVENLGGDTVLTTDGNGQVQYGYVIKPGTYTVFEVNADGRETRINSFTVVDTCEATVKPRSSGGGGWTPPPTDPEDPNPEEPGEPTDPEDPNPEEPGEPTDPEDPNPEEPGEPTDPENPDPEEPGEPIDPENPDPEEPGKPTDPENPDGGDSGTPGGDKPGEGGDANTPGGGKPGEGGDANTPDGGKPGQGGDSNTPGGNKPGKSDTNAPGTGKLPQTGEEHYMYMIALGIILLAAGAFVLYRPRRKA